MLKSIAALGLFTSALAMPTTVLASDARITGVSQFLIERAADNALYMLEKRIESNGLFACYLPNTYDYVTSGHFQLLLQSGSQLWQSSVEKDLANIGVQQVYQLLNPATLKSWMSQLQSSYIGILQNNQVLFEGEYIALDALPTHASEAHKQAVNAFTDGYLSAYQQLENAHTLISQSSDACQASSLDFDQLSDIEQQLRQAATTLSEQLALLNESDVTAGSTSSENQALMSQVNRVSDLLSSLNLSDELSQYRTQLSRINQSDDGVMSQLFALEQLIASSIEAGDNPFNTDTTGAEYRRFSQYLMAFALLSNASSSTQVQSVLSSLTTPSISFGSKRQHGEWHVMVSSYLGAGVSSNTPYAVLTAPVGLELSYGLSNNDALSLMVSPLDFGYPVSLFMQDALEWSERDESSVEFSDLVVPSLHLAYGFEHYPLLLGVSYAPFNDQQIQVNVAFDMPLWSLY